MKIRPVDNTGDILPVQSTSDMVLNAEAVALLVQDRLELLYGEWWENRSWGNQILRQMQEHRISEAALSSLSVYLADYVRNTEGVKEIIDIKYEMEGSNFSWQCTVLTDYGSAAVSYEF